MKCTCCVSRFRMSSNQTLAEEALAKHTCSGHFGRPRPQILDQDPACRQGLSVATFTRRFPTHTTVIGAATGAVVLILRQFGGRGNNES